MFDDPQVRHLDPVMELDHPEHGPIHTVRSGVNLSDTPFRVSALPPELGEHTVEILRELGFGEQQIEALEAGGAI